MTKYNEVMNRVSVSEEMKGRVLANVEEHFEAAKRKNRRLWYSIVTTAAAVAVIMIVIQPWNKTQTVTPPQVGESSFDLAGIYQEMDFASAEELSAAVGFEVPEMSELPFTVKETAYCQVTDFGEIRYYGEEESLIQIKSLGLEDNSGDYNEHPVVEPVQKDDHVIMLKGDKDGFTLAIWNDKTYSYSLLSSQPLTKEEMMKLVDQADN